MSPLGKAIQEDSRGAIHRKRPLNRLLPGITRSGDLLLLAVAYLVDVFKRLPTMQASEVEQLMPIRWADDRQKQAEATASAS